MGIDSKELKIDVVDIAFILKGRWKVIVVFALIFSILGFRKVSRAPILYSAQATLMIRSSGFDESKNLENMATLLEIAKSKTITQRVVQKYGLHISPGALAGGISIQPVRGTEFIKLSYTGTEPALTAAVANEVASEFIKRVEEILNRSNLKILEPAEVPRFPRGVNKIRIISMYLMVGLGIGIFLAVALELFNRRLRRSEEMERILGTEVIGVVPDLKKFYPKGSVKRDIFFDNDSLKEVRESIRLIRTNINFIDMKKNKVILFSSSIPKEGKTTIASNYALSEAIAGKKVIILDCDVKRPRLDKSYGVESKYGMADLLKGEISLKEVIKRDVRKNLDVIMGGKSEENTTELFLNYKMEDTIEELRKEYDLVVIDTPPLAVGTDGAIISKFVDGIVFIISYDQVHKAELEFSKKILETAKSRLYGLVINKVSNEGYAYGEYGYYSYNYSYYKNYYESGEGKNEKNVNNNGVIGIVASLLSRVGFRRGSKKS
ncbi:polysaccharide biosynthesis tyrosine autokinase [Cetobacterium sp.]|uniref:polysaccharide biosynthesis tyrosine autokinase n=2 Tax=Cetobacterium sp. TaxID=2071632 RepID=UPI003EE68B31